MSFPISTLRAGTHGLQLESVALADIARAHGTPCYVYSRAALEANFAAWQAAVAGRDTLVCYAVKANSNLAVLNVFARLGAGFDIVSGGELSRVLAAGGSADKTVFSGVGKSTLPSLHSKSHKVVLLRGSSPGIFIHFTWPSTKATFAPSKCDCGGRAVLAEPAI